MGKLIKRIKLTSFIIIMIQLVAVIVLAILYYANLFNLDLANNEDFKKILVPTTFGLVFVDCLFLWIVIMIISSLRKKTDLRAAEVIGSDVQEAYNFAMIGLAVTDDKDVVIWTNDLFKDRHIDIIDRNILEWKEELKSIRNATSPDTTTKIVYNSHNYEVKYLAEACLYIFKDITEYESIYAYSKKQAPVIGTLAIDNYDEVVRGEDDFNDTVSRVKNEIFSYAKEYGVLLRRIKDDNYSMLCTYESFLNMKADRFSVIDKVRNVSSGQDIPLTISIGIAHDFPDVIKLNELANEALDIAMSRGGDQVVVSVYGQDKEYFGGKTEAQEKRNRVKIRVYADSLISSIKASSSVLIMGHADMDMDALGACLGVKAICDRLEKPARIIVDLKNTEAKTRSAMISSIPKEELDKITISSKDAEDMITANTLLVVVDVSVPKRTMAPRVLEKVSKTVVIDHHRRGDDYIENTFNVIDPAASSTCELIAEFIRFASIDPRTNLSPMYATIMLSGIFLDSSYYKSRNTGMRTFEASTILKEFGADNALADDFLKDDFEEHRIVEDIIVNKEHPQYGIVVATASNDEIYDTATISKAANTCLTFKGVHAAFVIGRVSNKEVKISARSDGSINVQLLTEKLGGGGHFSMAAVTFEKAEPQEAKKALLKVLATSVKEASMSSEDMDSEGM